MSIAGGAELVHRLSKEHPQARVPYQTMKKRTTGCAGDDRETVVPAAGIADAETEPDLSLIPLGHRHCRIRP